MKKEIALATIMAACMGAREACAGLLYEPSSYAAQGNLILNLDGIRNVGALKAHDGAAAEWKDLTRTVNDVEFIAKDGDASAWVADGYHFAGGCYGKLKIQQAFGDTFTIQIVADVKKSENTTSWPTLLGNWNDSANIYCNANDVYFKADYSTGLDWTNRAKLSTWGGKYLNAALEAASFKQILSEGDFATGWKQGSKDKTYSIGSPKWTIGSAGNGGALNQSDLDRRYLVGTIKAIRVYNKVLSNTELAANRAIDEARFFAGIPVTNVVVATTVPGVDGNESAGVYAYDADGYTFTAPQRMEKDGVSYVCAGYTLERWNGTAWGPAQLFSSAAYAAADTNACVRLTWQWRATGGVASVDLDPLFDNYVRDGLLLHVDGIRNAGADKPHDSAASAWVDLVDGKIAPFYHDTDDASAWREDGYYFGGTSFAQFTATMKGLTNTVTVQVVCDTVPSQLKRTVKWPNLVGCNDNDACNVYYNTSGQLTFKNANGGNVFIASDSWLGRYATAIRAGTTNYITQGTTLAGAAVKETSKGNISSSATVRIGSAGSTLGLRQDRWFTGVIKAVRIYDRVLTDEELAANRAIDEVRFFGAALPITNVVVASSVRGLSGGEPEGAYMLSAGGHTFTAPATMTTGDDTYSCTGYTLETWDDATGTWGEPVLHGGVLAAAITDLTARVRLTWQWTHTAGPGFDAAFNDYVTDGLVIHLDGIRNTGIAPVHDDTAATWADLSTKGGYARFIHNADDGSAWAADGYTFGGKEYFGGQSYAQMNGTRTFDGPYTFQEVVDFDREVANRINVPWPNLVGTTDAGDKFVIYYCMQALGTPDVRFKVNNTYLYSITGWGGDYVTTIFNGTQTASFKGATTEGVTWKDFTYVPGTQTFTFGSGNGWSGGYGFRYVTGTIKGVRFYNRALTDAELARNRAADEVRFFGRPAATGELVVSSDVKGLGGNQPCGAYRPAGGYSFTAPEEAWLDGTPYELAGYTLETWDGSAWGSAVAYDGMNAVAPDVTTASKRLTWNWRVKSRLTRIRTDYDVSDYVQTDLYLHLDGIRNAGATADHDDAATTWADLANGNDATFDFANAGVTGDGWTDNGYRFVYGGKFAGLPDTLNFGSNVTIQAVCDVGASGKPSGDSWQTLFGATNDYCNIYTGDRTGTTAVMKIFNNQSQVKDTNNVITIYAGGRKSVTWAGRYVTVIWSTGKYTIFQDAIPSSSNWSGTWRYNWEEFTGRPFYVGGVYFPEGAGETNNRRLTGTIHALRVYKRALSDTELEHNRMVDEARFFGNLPESNVIVAQGKYDASTETVGNYLVEGTYTFTAENAVEDGKTRRVIGCMVETWDGNAWSTPVFSSGDSYTYTVGTSPAKVRLTWKWQGGGTVLSVR